MLLLFFLNIIMNITILLKILPLKQIILQLLFIAAINQILQLLRFTAKAFLTLYAKQIILLHYTLYEHI